MFCFTNYAKAQTPFQHPAGQYITIKGSKLWVEIDGKGDPLFLISGGPGGSHVGMHSFDGLKDSSTLVYIDNFGRGKSDTATDVKDYSIDRDVEDIEGIRKELGYDQINLLGHSYGGVVAQLYAVKYPKRVKHLIIADSFFSGAMWQENDDNSNHEIAENYPEVWDSLMILRNKGFVSSDVICADLYGTVPMDFYTHTIRITFFMDWIQNIPIASIQNYLPVSWERRRFRGGK